MIVFVFLVLSSFHSIWTFYFLSHIYKVLLFFHSSLDILFFLAFVTLCFFFLKFSIFKA